MGCGACGKIVGGVVEGDIVQIGEGIAEGGQVVIEHLGDFWSMVGDASVEDAAEAAGGVAEAAADGAAGVAEAAADGAGDALGAIGSALAHVDPRILVASLDLLCQMHEDRIQSALEQVPGEAYLTALDLGDDAHDVYLDDDEEEGDGTTILEKACKPLDLVEAAFEAREEAEILEKGTLSQDEAGAIYLYTGNLLYQRLNEDLRHRDRRKARPYFAYLRVFTAAFEKLVDEQKASMPGLVFRGCPGDLKSQYAEGKTVVWWAVSSTTSDISVAKNFAGKGGTVFHINARRAVSIQHLSAVQDEKEYILSPGTRLRVMKVTQNSAGNSEVFLSEIPGEPLISVVGKKTIPVVWKNAETSGHFDQMIEVVPANAHAGSQKRKVFQDILDLSWKMKPTQDRPCPQGTCAKKPGGCDCLRKGAYPGMPEGLKVHRVLRFEDSKMWSRYSNRTVDIQQARDGSVKPLDRPLKQEKVWAKFKGQEAALTRASTRGLVEGAFAPLAQELNEVYLFHGTGAAAAHAICEDGFLLSKAGSNVGTMYGAGVYLTDSCSKSDEYAKADEAGIFRLLMCRTCLGKPFVTTERDQNAGDNFVSGDFDCTLGDREKAVGTYREFVLYDTAQIYPEFIIEYKRRGKFYESQYATAPAVSTTAPLSKAMKPAPLPPATASKVVKPAPLPPAAASKLHPASDSHHGESHHRKPKTSLRAAAQASHSSAGVRAGSSPRPSPRGPSPPPPALPHSLPAMHG